MKSKGNGNQSRRPRLLALGEDTLMRRGFCQVLGTLPYAPEIDQAVGLQEVDHPADGLDGQYELVFAVPATAEADPGTEVELLKAIFRQTPVAVLSLDDSPDSIRRALNAGAAGFLPVTSSPHVVSHAVQLMLAGSRYVPAAIFAADRSNGDAASMAGERQLTERQAAVLKELAKGHSNKQIAAHLALSEATVKVHVAALMRILNARNRTQAVLIATEAGMAQERTVQ